MEPASFKPPIRTIRPMRAPELPISAIGGIPKGVHQVIVHSHSGAAKPNYLVQLLHGEGLGQLDIIRQFIISRPVVIDSEWLVDGDRSAHWRQSLRLRPPVTAHAKGV